MKRPLFTALRDHGKRVHTRSFLASVMENRLPHCRMGITVSGKVGNAVERNRLKRLIREYYRTHKDVLPGSWDINIIAKKNAACLSNRQVPDELDMLFGKIAGV